MGLVATAEAAECAVAGALTWQKRADLLQVGAARWALLYIMPAFSPLGRTSQDAAGHAKSCAAGNISGPP